MEIERYLASTKTKRPSCRTCRHFDVRGQNNDGMAYGMCRAWRFSINEHDGRNCKKREPKETHYGETGH